MIKELIQLLGMVFKGVVFVLRYIFIFVFWYIDKCKEIIKDSRKGTTRKIHINEEII